MGSRFHVTTKYMVAINLNARELFVITVSGFIYIIEAIDNLYLCIHIKQFHVVYQMFALRQFGRSQLMLMSLPQMGGSISTEKQY